MSHQSVSITFDQLARDPGGIFDRVQRENVPLRVVRNGEIFTITAEPVRDIWDDYDPDRVRQMLAATAGSLKDIDVEELLADLDAQREQGPDRIQ